MTNNSWNKYSWRSFKITQQPTWENPVLRDEILKNISQLPALVFAGETRTLKNQLSEVSKGKAFLLHAGECSEEFSRCHGPNIHDIIKVILRMSVILAYSGEKKVINIGRIAGQYAKPRSSNFEMINGNQIPSYRGDMVNGIEPNINSRKHDAKRMLEGYFRSTATLNLIRAFTRGGYAALEHAQSWSDDSFGTFPGSKKYDEIVRGIKKAINFANAMGMQTNSPQLNEVIFYTSHEALLLEYEEAMTRIDTTTDDWYNTSTHMLWIGDRTRQLDGAHVEFLRGVGNPIGLKIGPNFNIDELKKIIFKLNPDNESGKINLITRLGANKILDLLPFLIKEMKKEGFDIVWSCDPMHGNTYVNKQGKKTRNFETILTEVRNFWEIHNSEKSIAGGVHLEISGEDVTECIGGSRKLLDIDLKQNYKSSVDPRLNAEQAIELAFEIAKFLNPDS